MAEPGSNTMEQEVPATEPGEETCEAAPLVVDCTALTNETLREAVKRWSSDEERETLPPMATWNTSAVTDMSALFCVREDWMDGRAGMGPLPCSQSLTPASTRTSVGGIRLM